MKVPLLDLKAQFAPIKDEVYATVTKVFENANFIMGDDVKKLEEEVAAYSNVKHGIGVASGTDALLLALMAIDIEPGDEVITTPYTFFATAGSISRVGAVPVFVDIEPKTYNIDVTKIEEKITAKTKAIMPVHLYGQCADMKAIMDLAVKYNLYVIEDAAQAIGAECQGERAGSMGHMGCFSFFPSKNLGGFGDGGMVVTNSDALAEKLRILRVHGSKPKYYHKMIGCNSRLDTIQAAGLRVKLKYLDAWTEGRQKNAAIYDKLFLQTEIIDKPTLPYTVSGNRHIYNQYVLRVPKRDELRKFLQENEIGNEVYYPVPLHLQECYKDLGYKEGDLPQAEKAAKETIALPIYPELTLEMQEYVAEKVGEFIIRAFL